MVDARLSARVFRGAFNTTTHFGLQPFVQLKAGLARCRDLIEITSPHVDRGGLDG